MRVSRKVFDQMVERAIADLPEEFARWVEQVPVIVEDEPRRRRGRKGESEEEEVLGFYEGVSLEGKMEDSGRLPPRIVLYRRPLMEACATQEDLAEEIRKTLLHELGHHAGMDEQQLERLGYGPLEEEDEIEWDVDEEEGDKGG